MQPMPNRMGLGLRPHMPSFGQGPSMQALAQQQHPSGFAPPQAQRATNLFIGSISAGITDAFLNRLLNACGPIKAFKRLITPANKPQGFGFAEFEDPDSALRAMALLNGVELPALEDGAQSKKLLVKADEKTQMFLSAYSAQRMKTDEDDATMSRCKAAVDELVHDIQRTSQDAAGSGNGDRERYVIPPHLHDLHEAELPEAQRGLVISEIAQFREKAAIRERDRSREMREAIPSYAPNAPSRSAPAREWGRPQSSGANGQRAVGSGPQGYDKPVGFVKGQDGGDERSLAGKAGKTDEELEQERKEARRKDEENSFRDRERRYEPRERTRVAALERAIMRERAVSEAEARDREEMKTRLDVWDDDESDETFYTDRARWRHLRARRLATEEQTDRESAAYEEREAENLRRESEAFLARQMEDMQALQDEQRKAGMLLDDGAPVKLNVSLAPAAPAKTTEPAAAAAKVVFTADEEEEEAARRRKVPLVKLDFSAAAGGEKALERLEKIKEMVPRDKETLFKAKVRWDGLSDTVIDRKFDSFVKRLMVKYLGELEDDDLVMFVLEHLKDHKSPQKLVEGLEPVLEEDALELTINVWRQVIFESMAYGEGLHTETMMVD